MQDGVTAPHATVVATDEGLRLSLVCLLELCGIDVVALAGAEELLTNCRLEERFIFLDCTFSGCEGLSEIDELRRRGWQGIVIFMAEGAGMLDPRLEDEQSRVLVKPFSSDDVLAIIAS